MDEVVVSSVWTGWMAWCLGALVVLALALALDIGLRRRARGGAGERAPTPMLMLAIATGLLLKPMLAWRLLRDEVLAVEVGLVRSLPEGRERLARLVSRPVDRLDATQVRESAIETLAENLNDSVVAPLFWFAVAGLPGAALYRFANTADAMWGYKDHRRWMGAWAARADDALSWLPARLLGVRLNKPGAYALNAQARLVRPEDLPQAVRWCECAVWWAWAGLGCLSWLLAIGVTHG